MKIKENFLNNKYIKFSLILIVLITISVFSIGLFLHRPLDSSYSDIRFHYSRIQGMSNYFISPANFKSFGNQGKVINEFYPIITLLPFSILNFFTKNFNIIYKLIWVFISLINSFIAYCVMKKFTKSDLKATLFAIVWTLGVCRIDKTFYSNAIGNVYSMAFLPIILIGMFYVFFDDYKKWYYLVLGVILVGFTHMLTLILMVMFCTIVAIISIILRKKMEKKRLKYILFSLFMITLGLAVSIIPMMEQKHAYALLMPKINLDVGNITPMHFIISSINNISGIGVINLFVVIYMGVKFKNLSKFEKSIYLASVIFVILSTNLVPWILLKMTPLIQIQDTGRLYTYSNLGLYFIFINQFDTIFGNNKIWPVIILTFSMLTLSFVQSIAIHDWKVKLKESHHVPIEIINKNGKDYLDYPHMDYANVGYEFGLDGKHNYSAKWASHVRKNRKFYILNKKIIKPKLTITSNLMTISFNNTNNKTVNLTTRQSVHLGLNVTVNGKFTKPQLSEYGTLKLSIPANKNITIKLWYKYTFLARFTQLLSFSTFICTLLYFIWKEKLINKSNKLR